MPLQFILDGIAEQPASPEFGWLYGCLFLTVVPSLCNLIIGASSILRGIPGFSKYICGSIRKAQSLPDKAWLSCVLAAHGLLATCLGATALVLVLFVLVYAIMPVLSISLLDLARASQALDLPSKLEHIIVQGG